MSAHTSYAERLLFDRLERQGEWVSRSMCAGADKPDRWFPNQKQTPGRARDVAEAKAVCAMCPVRAACLEWALKAREPHGIFGGLTEQERAMLRRAS